MQTSPFVLPEDKISLVISNPTASDDSTIPFFDETQQNSMTDEKKSHYTLSRQRTRNFTHVSERVKQDNESTVTVRRTTAFSPSPAISLLTALSSQASHQIRSDHRGSKCNRIGQRQPTLDE